MKTGTKVSIIITSLAVAAVIAVIAYLFVTRWLKYQPVTGKVTSKFGPRTAPLPGASTNHNGVDVSVPVGTKVLSPWAGTVENVYSNSLGGKQMIVKHRNGYTTGYAHLSEQLKAKGDKVRAGEVIALSGNTGNSTGPHLHFTLRKNGELIDPETIFNFK